MNRWFVTTWYYTILILLEIPLLSCHFWARALSRFFVWFLDLDTKFSGITMIVRISHHVLCYIHIIDTTFIKYFFWSYRLIFKRWFFFFLLARYWYVFWITAIIIRAAYSSIIYSFIFLFLFIIKLFTRFIMHLFINGASWSARYLAAWIWIWSLIVIIMYSTWFLWWINFLWFRLFNFIAILRLDIICIADRGLLLFN